MMDWPDLYARKRSVPDAFIPYGPDPLQHCELWLPDGQGPHPTILFVHGGCWQSDIAGAWITRWAAADLRARGYAVWNIEYRGIDKPSGGYPGTFADVAAAADALRDAAQTYPLSIDPPVAVGHSAGGHLALWLASRASLPASSPLHAVDPLPIHAAISLGGLPDLEAAALSTDEECGGPIIARLVGASSADRPDPYVDTSPARLTTVAAVTLINTACDGIAPPELAEAYARRTGGGARCVVVPHEGHVDLIAPGTQAWAALLEVVGTALG